MNLAQFKDPISHMCLAGTVVASLSPTQEVVGSSPFTVITYIFVAEFTEFSETFRKNSIVFHSSVIRGNKNNKFRPLVPIPHCIMCSLRRQMYFSFALAIFVLLTASIFQTH